MTNSMMMRDAVVSMEFLNSIARVEERSPRLFSMSQPAQEDGKTEFFTHVSRLPDVFRAHVYVCFSPLCYLLSFMQVETC